MKKFSLIIPVYNVEKYLSKCLDSVVNQSYDDFEAILIDDGSSDSSGKICDEYAQKDSRIRVIHKKNGGVSNARNNGIEIASGEYIVFIDSDDYVDDDYLAIFSQYDSDLIISGFVEHFEDWQRKSSRPEVVYSKLDNKNRLDLMENFALFTICAAAFKRELINKSPEIRFRADMSYGEDSIFALSVAKRAQSAAVLSENPYHYIRYAEGSLSKSLSKKTLFSYFECEAFIDSWLKEMGLHSDIFDSCDFPLRSKIKQSFYKIFENNEMALQEKKEFYDLFLQRSSFRKNADTMFPEMSAKVRFIIKLGSSLLLVGYQKLISCFH